MARWTSRWIRWLSAAAVFGSCASFAAPVQYTLTFDPGQLGSGPAGTGTFTYDSATQQGGGLTWNFGNGETGGVLDGAYGPGQVQFLFEKILMNVTNDPNAYGASFSAGLPATFGPFGEDSAQFCWGTLSGPTCEMDNPGIALASYRIYDAQGDIGPVYRGYLTIEPLIVEVPEPSMPALVLAALLAAGIVPAWARRAAVSARRRPHSS